MISFAIGAFLAGALYGVLAAWRLDAWPLLAVVACAVAFGLLAALGSVVMTLIARVARRVRKKAAPAESPAVVSLARGFIRSAGAFVFLALIGFVFIRQMADKGGVIDPLPMPVYFAFALGGLWGAFGLWQLGERVAPRVARVPPLALGAGPFALIAIIGFAASAPPRSLSDAGVTPPVSPEAPGGPTVVLLAIDGFGSRTFERYADRMPNLHKFAREAAHGETVPTQPILSQALWTSLATGLSPAEHGVVEMEVYSDDPRFQPVRLDDFYEDPLTSLLFPPLLYAWERGHFIVLPSTRYHRKGTPFWTTPSAGRVALVCFTATWPADHVSGNVVTDRWPVDKAEMLYGGRDDFADVTWPPDLREELRSFRKRSGDAIDPALKTLAAWTDVEIADAGIATDRVTLPSHAPFATVYYATLEDDSCMDAARYLLETKHPSTLVLRLTGVDHIGHLFLPSEKTGTIPMPFPKEAGTRLAPMMGNYLERLDSQFAWVLALGGPQTTTMVVADHDLVERPSALFGNWHGGKGIFLVRGPGFEPEKDLGGHSMQEWHDTVVEILRTTHERPANQ